jgi:demethoxyubiquinone hydroxylase (CLK1/Coq7/Cat5 family)
MCKITCSLNFMYFMERFATQIYRSQLGAFKGSPIAQQMKAASENEAGHVNKLSDQLRRLKRPVYPLGFLFQFVGMGMGLVTRLKGKRNLLLIDAWIETRAVKDYGSFARKVGFDADTVKMIQQIIGDEKEHIVNWKTARDVLAGKKASAA